MILLGVPIAMLRTVCGRSFDLLVLPRMLARLSARALDNSAKQSHRLAKQVWRSRVGMHSAAQFGIGFASLALWCISAMLSLVSEVSKALK